MTGKDLVWKERGSRGDWDGRSRRFLGREYVIRSVTVGGHVQLMVHNNPESWVTLATYNDLIDARDAAAYHDRWGRLPNHIPRSES
jgi:hypothetical protein